MVPEAGSLNFARYPSPVLGSSPSFRGFHVIEPLIFNATYQEKGGGTFVPVETSFFFDPPSPTLSVCRLPFLLFILLLLLPPFSLLFIRRFLPRVGEERVARLVFNGREKWKRRSDTTLSESINLPVWKKLEKFFYYLKYNNTERGAGDRAAEQFLRNARHAGIHRNSPEFMDNIYSSIVV